MTKRACADSELLDRSFERLANDDRTPVPPNTAAPERIDRLGRPTGLPLPAPPKRRKSRTARRAGHQGQAHRGHPTAARTTLADQAIRIRRGLKKGADGIIEAAFDLYRVKQQKLIKHGLWATWIENEVRVNIRTAEWLICIAKDPVIPKPCHRHALPASIRTIYELTRIKSSKEKRRLITNGTINRGILREEAIALRWTKKQAQWALAAAKQKRRLSKKQAFTPKATPDVATAIDACIQLDGGDVVIEHIRRQVVARKVSVAEFERAARSISQRLSQHGGKEC